MISNYNSILPAPGRMLRIAIFLTVTSLSPVVFSGIVEDAMTDDIAKLCDDKSANELYKIANKQQNTQETRRVALASMIEVSLECATASSNRLKQYHQKMIGAAHKIIELSEIDSREVAVEAFQHVITQPDANQPSEGSITRGQALADVALTDSEANIRLWALEALVTLRGNHTIVTNTLTAATNDNAPIVQQTAAEMLTDLQ